MPPEYLTIVLKLPDDEASRAKVSEQFMIGQQFHGARVTAFSKADEITINEFIEQQVSEDVMEEARIATKKLHIQVEEAGDLGLGFLPKI